MENAAGTPTAAGGNGGQSLGYGPPPPSTPTMTVPNGVEAALLKLKEKATGESVHREFNRQLQLQPNYNNTEAQTFWEGNIYNMGGIRVFGVMKDGSPYVQCLWGVGKYTDEDTAGDVGEGVLGRQSQRALSTALEECNRAVQGHEQRCRSGPIRMLVIMRKVTRRQRRSRHGLPHHHHHREEHGLCKHLFRRLHLHPIRAHHQALEQGTSWHTVIQLYDNNLRTITRCMEDYLDYNCCASIARSRLRIC